jgi:hypothetical protein
MSIEENILNLYDFDLLREQLLRCVQNEALIPEYKDTFQKEYKILRKAAIDFIDEVNAKIKEVESHEYYGQTIAAKNSIYYLRNSHRLSDTASFKVYGVANFTTTQNIQNLLSFAYAVEVLKKDSLVWVESYRLPLKISKKRRALQELWNDFSERSETFDSSDLTQAINELDIKDEYVDFVNSTYQILLDTEQIMHRVDFTLAPFHSNKIENIESLFDVSSAQALNNLASLNQFSDEISDWIFDSQFKK